jgi:hypothetical protein
VLSHSGGQVFLTTTHPEFILLENDRVDFQVDAGRVTSRVTGRVTSRVTR